MKAESPQHASAGRRFTISYAGFNRPWAVWISRQLTGLGHQVALLRWDPGAERPLVSCLEDLLLSRGQVLLLLDNWYFRLGPRSMEEWTEALRRVVPPHADRFAAVSVATQALPSTASALRPVDLRDLGETEARRLVLRRLDLSPYGPDRGDPELPGGPRFPHNPPEIRRLPPRNDRFTGRDPILEQLYELLESGGAAGSRCLLQGVSGVGKSQLAAEYAHRFGNDYDVVWWVDANHRVTAREQLATLAPLLNPEAGPEIGNRIRLVHQELGSVSRSRRRWLLIFDGGDRMADIRDLLPDGPGHVIVTSLTRDWSSQAGLHEVEVRPFLRTESVAFARRQAPRLTPAEAEALAEAVQDLPLLLAQTAAWLNTSSMPAGEYIEAIRRGEPGRLRISIGEDYPKSFQTAWSITLEALRDEHPEAAEVLRLLARFSADQIPVRLLETARPGDLPEPLAALAADPISWHSALSRLAQHTALQLDYQGALRGDTARIARMHRLYHAFLRNETSEEEQEEMAATACRILVGADPRRPTDTREWPRYAELIPHLEPSGALDSSDPNVHALILNCVEYLKLRGEYTTGLWVCEQALARWRSKLEPTAPARLGLALQHSNLLRRLGRYREAEATGRSLLAVLADREADDTDLLNAKNSLGGTLNALAELDEALGLFDEIVRQYAARLGPEAPHTLQARNNLGICLRLLGRYQDALAEQQASGVIRERALGSDHHQTLQSNMSYAWTLRLMGQYTEALSRQELNTRLHRQVMGANNPETLRSEHNLALCLRRNGDQVAAAQLMRDNVARSGQVLGQRHPDTLMVEADYATLLRELGQLDEARSRGQAVADRYRELVGPEHPYAVGAMANMGLVCWEYGEREQSTAIAEQAWRAMVAAVGPVHPWTLGCALNLAGARALSGDAEGALAASREVLEHAVLVLGEDHPMTLSCHAALADDLRELRRGDEADEHEKRALAGLTHAYGAEHIHTLSIRRRERPYWDFEPQPV